MAIPSIRGWLVSMAVCVLACWCFPSALMAQDDASLPGEMPGFQRVLPGEVGTTWLLAWAPRYYSVTDTRGFDDSFMTRWLNMNYLALRGEGQFEYRLTHDSSVLFRPALGLGYSYDSWSTHQLFALRSIDREVAMPARVHAEWLGLEMGLQAGYRYASVEFFLEQRSLYGWRYQTDKASTTTYINSSTGLLDQLKEQSVSSTSRYVSQAPGLGLGWHFGEMPWNYRAAILFHPSTFVEFNGQSERMDGFGVDLRAGGLALSDDSALFLSFRWDFWISENAFNRMHYFEVGLGLRFS